jgi:5-methylcytosine-specific restriction protein B
VDLGSSNLGRDYAASVVLAKYFSAADLAGSQIGEDFATATAAYAELLEDGTLSRIAMTRGQAVMSVYVGRGAEPNFESGGRRGWWGWRQSFRELGDVQPGDLILFGFGYSGGSPRVDERTWADHALRRAVIGRIEQAPFRTDEAVMPDELAGQDSYPYKVRFEILDEVTDLALGSTGGLSPAVAEAQRLSAIGQGAGIVRSIEGSELLESIKSQTNQVPLDVIAADFSVRVRGSGLVMPDHLVNAFLVAALAKPFLILTGLSGSGQTQLAQKLGEWCGTDQAGKTRYQVVPVRPDWTGPEYLFGFRDALQARVRDRLPVWAVPDTLEFLLRANADPDMLYVLLLDEMNLAHVERYFADFLSGLESREPVLPDLHLVDGKWVEKVEGHTIPVPRNVIVVGTVNVDETTYLFSPKVLDRAFTFEFRVTDEDLDPTLRRPTPIEPASRALLRTVVEFGTDDEAHFQHPHPEVDGLATDLRELHRTLASAGLEFGHRVMYESLRFASFLHAAAGTPRDGALDLIAMSKILPRIHGSRQRLEPVLRQVIAFAEGDDEGTARLPMTARKARRMLDVLLDVQFVSFTE